MAQGLRITVGLLVAFLVAASLWAAARRPRNAGPGPSTYLGHFLEFRRRLLWSAAAVAAGTLFAFSFRLGPDPWWLPVPAVHGTLAAQIQSLLAAHTVPDEVTVTALRPMDALSAEITVSLLFGLAVASPFVTAQAAAFFGPALRPHEARALRRAVLPVVLLFLTGAGFALGWVAPALLEALYGYAEGAGAAAIIAPSDLIGFTASLAVLFGAAFETPLIMAVLSRAGLVAPGTWASHWRHAFVGILILCALVTDGTIVTLALVTLPLFGLYGLGVAAAHAAAQRRVIRDDGRSRA